jgi:sporulation protein YlmC with PRC-barrel domain
LIFVATAKKRYTGDMLQLSETLLNRPVMSLRTGTMVATTVDAIINPNNLKIEGFYCQDTREKQPLVLLYQDIRELIPQGFVVDDHDVLVEPDELVRLKDILRLDFQILGKQVETSAKEKVGKVSDYAADSATMYIQRLYISQSVFKSLTGGNLSVDRTQIVEITNKKVIIQELNPRVPAHARAVA